MSNKKNKESEIVKLARETIEEYVKNGLRKQVPSDLPPAMQDRKGVFVSLKKNGKLRGCIGTTRPTQKNIAEEVISNAINASTHDPRFPPVQPEELDDLEISVDILGDPEPVSNREELDPEKYGIIVKKGHQTGLLLPDLEGIDKADDQINIARKKAGINPGDDVELFRFEVHRYR